MLEQTEADLDTAAEYTYHTWQVVKGLSEFVTQPGTYKYLMLVKHVHTHQMLVIYKCVETGEAHACPLVDWHTKFKRGAKAPNRPTPMIQTAKVVRHASTGSEF